ncbi:glycerol-3-phosphate 1-O-acyltransferase PlsY [bacterium]|nr:glycerol-3-phosphate 1-O-acyltransferase PlsY [bacterium]
MLSLVVIIVLGYLAGSVPTAIITSRVLMKDDIRNHGSRNAGATNVFRIMGWKPALFVVLVDMAKGLLAVLFVSKIVIDPVPWDMPLIRVLAGVAAIVGHIWTVFAGFRGGKGVGTAFGVLVALIPVPALTALVLWIVLVLTTRYVSVGSMTAALSLPVTMLCQRHLFHTPVPDLYFWIGTVIALLIVFTHRANIGRLIRGEENRFGSKKKSEEKPS